MKLPVDLLVPTDLGDVLDVHVAMSMLMLIGYFYLATGRSIWREKEIVLF